MLGQLGTGAQHPVGTHGVAERMPDDVSRQVSLHVRRDVRCQARQAHQRHDPHGSREQQTRQPQEGIRQRTSTRRVHRTRDRSPGEHRRQRDADAPAGDPGYALPMAEDVGDRRLDRHPSSASVVARVFGAGGRERRAVGRVLPQFGVGSDLAYASVHEPGDDIGARRRARSMGDDEGSPFLRQGTQSREDARGRRDVQAAQRIVQHQRRGVAQRSACQAQPLPFSPRHRCLLQRRVVAVRKTPDECVRLHAPRSRFDLVVAGVVPQPDRIPYRVAEQGRRLECVGNASRQRLSRPCRQRRAIDPDHAAVRIVESADEGRQRRLADARCANESDGRAGRNVQIHAAQDVAVLAPHRHVIDLDVADGALFRRLARPMLHGRGVREFHQAPCLGAQQRDVEPAVVEDARRIAVGHLGIAHRC